MKKMRVLLAIICISLMLLQAACSNGLHPSVDDNTETLSKNGKGPNQIKDSIYLEDAKNLITVLEDTHPAFALGDIRADYEEEKELFIDSISKDTDIDDFTYMVQRYLAILQDGHTRQHRDTGKEFLDIDCIGSGEDLFIVNKDGSISMSRITQVGGIKTNKIFETVERYFSAENQAAKDMNNSLWALNKEVLKLAGYDLEDGSIDVDIFLNGKTFTNKISFIEKDINMSGSYKFYPEIESKKIHDVFYIDMNICNVNSTLDKHISKLKKAIEAGTNKVIIDVRDNPGGNSLACEKLLNAMDMNVPNYGVYIRYSELAKKHYSDIPNIGFKQVAPDKSVAKPNNNIDLVVLTNNKTFSSATMMATFVKDGGLGTIIGTTSSNAPSCYGDILYYEMENSGIGVSISYKRFLRPDTEVDQRILRPDIETQHNEDILETAIAYLNKR